MVFTVPWSISLPLTCVVQDNSCAPWGLLGLLQQSIYFYYHLSFRCSNTHSNCLSVVLGLVLNIPFLWEIKDSRDTSFSSTVPKGVTQLHWKFLNFSAHHYIVLQDRSCDSSKMHIWLRKGIQKHINDFSAATLVGTGRSGFKETRWDKTFSRSGQVICPRSWCHTWIVWLQNHIVKTEDIKNAQRGPS